MKFQIFSIGKANESYVAEGITMFTKRISNYYPVEWTIIPMLKNASNLQADEIKVKEGEAVARLLKKEDYLIVLDEKGSEKDSIQFARFLQQRADEAVKNLVFLIGGAFGVSEAILRRANFTMRLSNLVFPHQLVRLILAEQLYRACTIIRNEKYHHL